jgi:hypothetical protein
LSLNLFSILAKSANNRVAYGGTEGNGEITLADTSITYGSALAVPPGAGVDVSG